VSAPGHSLLIGALPLSSDFPTAEFVSAELEMRARVGTSPIAPTPTWTEFGAAWMAVAYRFLDATYFDQEFRDSIAKFGTAPEPPERYRQERHLFGFFVSGLSAIESFCYGLCALAWEADPRSVSLATPGQKKGVSPESTRDRFNAHFKSDAITANLDLLVTSADYKDWVDVRNALAHRTSPGRKHYRHLGSAPTPEPPSEWGHLILDDRITSDRRLWLRDTLASLLADAGRFAAVRF
jgi:hypothetical protein